MRSLIFKQTITILIWIKTLSIQLFIPNSNQITLPANEDSSNHPLLMSYFSESKLIAVSEYSTPFNFNIYSELTQGSGYTQISTYTELTSQGTSLIPIKLTSFMTVCSSAGLSLYDSILTSRVKLFSSIGREYHQGEHIQVTLWIVMVIKEGASQGWHLYDYTQGAGPGSPIKTKMSPHLLLLIKDSDHGNFMIGALETSLGRFKLEIIEIISTSSINSIDIGNTGEYKPIDMHIGQDIGVVILVLERGDIQIYNKNTLALARTVSWGDYSATSSTYMPSLGLVASGQKDANSVLIWYFQTEKVEEMLYFPSASSKINNVKSSDDGKSLVFSVIDDNRIMTYTSNSTCFDSFCFLCKNSFEQSCQECSVLGVLDNGQCIRCSEREGFSNSIRCNNDVSKKYIEANIQRQRGEIVFGGKSHNQLTESIRFIIQLTGGGTDLVSPLKKVDLTQKLEIWQDDYYHLNIKENSHTKLKYHYENLEGTTEFIVEIQNSRLLCSDSSILVFKWSDQLLVKESSTNINYIIVGKEYSQDN